ncbi:hypothetical protein [Streptomyces sp. NPDC051183]|uniref:hypothetical protein n=1 Tax=Streptomyces sp. NPDC051183 TaxID=3155165 RepID=UPI00342E5B37
MLDGTEWTVERREPHLGRVQLVAADGVRQRVSFRSLVNHPGCRPSSRTEATGADRGRQSKTVEDLKEERLALVELRMTHLLEVATGFRSGDPLRPGPGEPKPEYDPDTTTLTGRRRAKAAELAALDRQQARLLGLDAVSVHTLIRWETGRRKFGLIGCADDRWLRESGGHRTVTEEVREAILAVREETLRSAKVSMRTKDRMIRQYVRETFDAKDPDTGEAPETATEVPSYRTLCRVWKEWFGASGARQRYARSAELPMKNGHVVVHRPGQVVALDTTVLPVMVRDGVFGDPVKPHLTIALDTYTHSLVAFRLTLVSDTSVDVAMLLRDVMMPLPMRADWGDELEWPYPGLPAAVVSEFAGHKVAGLPFLTPETVTTDHGSAYRNHHLVEVQRVLGCNILPSRVLRPQDKAACERAVGSYCSNCSPAKPGVSAETVREGPAAGPGSGEPDPALGPEATRVEDSAEAEAGCVERIALWVVQPGILEIEGARHLGRLQHDSALCHQARGTDVALDVGGPQPDRAGGPAVGE